jgi:D-lactate dehydrogenase
LESQLAGPISRYRIDGDKGAIRVTFADEAIRGVNIAGRMTAEHAVALLLALNRKIPRAYNRTRDGNFELDGLMGFDLVNRTVAVLGTGKVGTIFGRIMNGFGCKVLGYDAHRSPEFEKIGRYAGVEEIQADADVISLHVPLTSQTKHVVNARTIAKVKKAHS